MALSIFVATSAFAALVETDNGPKFFTTVYVTGLGELVSGDCVILQTTSPTYEGAEVTGTATAGLLIYGVVVGDGCTETAGNAGTYVTIQTYGYCPIVRLAEGAAVSAGTTIVMAGDSNFGARGAVDLNVDTGNHFQESITGNSIALEDVNDGSGGDTWTFKAFLSW